MAFEALSERLQNSISFVGKGEKITEADLKQMMREIRLALLEADVNFKVVKTFVKKVNERALGSEVLDSLSPAQQVVKIVNEELTALMGGEHTPINISKQPPTVIMMAGLQGAGKTTTVGKLAKHLKEQGLKKPLLVAGDVYRPAAIDQLQTIGNQLGFDVYSRGTQANPVDIAKEALDQARLNGNEVVLIDTAGRLHVNEELMEELRQIKAAVQPDEILLTVDAMTGQDAVNVAAAFNDSLDITGVVITKLDGDTRGGAALSIRAIIDKPIKYTGQGEQLTALEPFHPDRMAGRILGMGDMMTLIEKAQQDFDEEQAAKMADKIKDASFDFNDFIDQMDQVRKMGPIKDLLKMIPGMNKIPGLEDFNIDDKEMNRVKAVVQSMTPYERANPDVISQSRRRRIAAGCGQSLQQVNQLIKQFNQSREMMSQMSNGKMGSMNKMMNQLQQGGQKGGMPNMGMPSLGKMQSPEQIQKEQEQKKIARLLKKKRKRK
ncbi:signal recognition particle protein [Facklamia sp. 7083-14-GEN3]|uniref:signal recognition particle protein n=1 Tax=Facklamia sp. 7083-14-GEN3 TaxID=2973478 RepID=UPI00215C2164|nr:signal recognition particle protein [Facklamia sp. 7083-14-GEN3]MCR8968765.1 signal recognition particle protein [Facklamia sp. 7083-14-GEN3]